MEVETTETSMRGSGESDIEEEPTPGVAMENGILSAALQDKIYIPAGSSLEYVSVKREVDADLPMSPGTLDVSADLVNVTFEEGDLPDSMFECCYCKILFAQQESLVDHLEEAHQGMEGLESTLQQIANDNDRYKIDTKTEKSEDGHRGKKKRVFKNCGLMCDYPGCGKKFIRRGALRTHQVVHEVSKECTHCGSVFKTVTALVRHVDRKHNVRTKSCRVDCIFPGCSKTFQNPSALKNHQHFHDERYRCLQCGVLFLQPHSLEKHVKSTHVEAKPQDLVECTGCGEMIPSWSISKHLQRSCKGRESLKSGLDGLEDDWWNEFSDIDDIPVEGVEYNCAHDGCLVSFETKRMLAWHLKYTFHHENIENDLPFHCPYKACEKLYPTKESLGDHMKEEHWGTKKIKTAAAQKQAKEATEKSQKSDTQRKCPVCCETFPSESKMKFHLKMAHSYDYEAPTDSDQLENSMESEEVKDEKNQELVFDLKMYRCPICQASYHTANGLKYHIKNHHKHLESALNYLCEVEANSEAFLHVVPATLYGDSFKSRRRKSRSESGPGSTKRVRKTSENEQEPDSESHVNMCESDTKEEDSEKSEKSKETSQNLEEDLDESGTHPEDILNTSGESSQDLDTPEKKDSNTAEADASEKVENSEEQNSQENGKSDKKKTDHRNVNLVCRYPNCFKLFKTRFELMCHQRKHEKLLKCPHDGCTHEFFNSNNLRLHIQLVHAESHDTKCKDCGIVGKRSYIVYRHPKFCPKTADLKCPKCEKFFKKVSSYTNHVRTHDKVQQANYPCEYDNCTKRFKTRQDRDRHHNVHSGARPHKCPYGGCNKTYKQRPHLLVHMKNRHTLRTEKDTRVFTCEHCNTNFKHSCGRSKHIRKSCLYGPHRDQILASRRKPLKASSKAKTSAASTRNSKKEEEPQSSNSDE